MIRDFFECDRYGRIGCLHRALLGLDRQPAVMDRL